MKRVDMDYGVDACPKINFPNPTNLATWVIPGSMSNFLHYDSPLH